jgi:hypothetical protein
MPETYDKKRRAARLARKRKKPPRRPATPRQKKVNRSTSKKPTKKTKKPKQLSKAKPAKKPKRLSKSEVRRLHLEQEAAERTRKEKRRRQAQARRKKQEAAERSRKEKRRRQARARRKKQEALRLEEAKKEAARKEKERARARKNRAAAKAERARRAAEAEAAVREAMAAAQAKAIAQTAEEREKAAARASSALRRKYAKLRKEAKQRGMIPKPRRPGRVRPLDLEEKAGEQVSIGIGLPLEEGTIEEIAYRTTEIASRLEGTIGQAPGQAWLAFWQITALGQHLVGYGRHVMIDSELAGPNEPDIQTHGVISTGSFNTMEGVVNAMVPTLEEALIEAGSNTFVVIETATVQVFGLKTPKETHAWRRRQARKRREKRR